MWITSAATISGCVQGGFIWDWVDQGLLHKVQDANGKTVEAWGYGGDFGDPVHDAQFNINGLIWPNREPHPGCWECKAVMVRQLHTMKTLVCCCKTGNTVALLRLTLVSPGRHVDSLLTMGEVMQAPVVFELTKGAQDKMGGLVVRARSKYTFQSTAGLLLTWRVLLDGVPLPLGDPAQGDAEGWYPGGSVPLAPQVRCGS